MSERICTYPACAKPQHGKGYCRGHCAQLQRGKALAPLKVRRASCDFPECSRKHYAGGACRAHYDQLRRRNAQEPLPERPLTPHDRFWAKVDTSGDCWLWLGAKVRGYGMFGGIGGGHVYAHRLAYAELVAPVPAGVEIDHMCHNRACVNPGHLRLASKAENQQHRLGANRNSRSGVRGVYRKRNAWEAWAQVEKRRHYIGSFADLADAERAAISWRRQNMPSSLADQARADRAIGGPVLEIEPS